MSEYEYRPHMLPKVRSEDLMNAIGGTFSGRHVSLPMPCTMRIAGLVGLRCADRRTVVGCHSGNLGKGMSTKVSDLSAIAGCMTCHALWDRVQTGWRTLHTDPDLRAQMFQRILAATHETQAMLVQDGIITVKGASLI
ncbi:DUF1364 domain-containing protein [Sulfitobacter sp. EhC04]|uniref:DUF1364 domain-containing protein n=1 Tax=Sulfitobacter sp. EhC04 TaxID=1849168 RepID=UPI0010FE7EA1|nr:DUF1364 domain-containing protein [Sulfitobacter sp. EhC04]